jgi:hypothetical protein
MMWLRDTELPESWSDMTNLVELDLGNGQPDDPMFGSPCSGNLLTGGLPSSWVGMTSLKYLAVACNKLSGWSNAMHQT